MAHSPRAFLRFGQAIAIAAGVLLLLPNQHDTDLLKDSGAGAAVAQLQVRMARALAAGAVLHWL